MNFIGSKASMDFIKIYWAIKQKQKEKKKIKNLNHINMKEKQETQYEMLKTL